jgi:hypothetical protein
MDWEKLLAYIAGSVDQELPLRNEYLGKENRILRNYVQGRVHLSDGERKVLEEALSRLSLFGERSFRYTLKQYEADDHQERPHQGGGMSGRCLCRTTV